MTEREIFKKYANLSEDELSEKSNKKVYVKNDVMTAVIKYFRGEKKEAKEKQMDLEKNWRFKNLRYQNAQNTKSNQKQETYL